MYKYNKRIKQEFKRHSFKIWLLVAYYRIKYGLRIFHSWHSCKYSLFYSKTKGSGKINAFMTSPSNKTSLSSKKWIKFNPISPKPTTSFSATLLANISYSSALQKHKKIDLFLFLICTSAKKVNKCLVRAVLQHFSLLSVQGKFPLKSKKIVRRYCWEKVITLEI